MNTDHLRTYLEVAQTRNFNTAALRLNVTQSTVSARIKALEERLDRRLFRRHRSGAELTSAGRQFHRYAVMAVTAWEQGRQEVALPAGYRTVLDIGAQATLWDRLVNRWIAWMRNRAPDVALRFTADYSDRVGRGLLEGTVDLGVMYMPRQASGLIVEQLTEDKLILVSTTRRKLNKEWVEDYVYVDWGEEFRTEHAVAFPEWTAPAVTIDLGSAALRFILENGGSGYFPRRSVRQLLDGGHLYRVARAPVFRRPIYMVYPSNPVDSDIIELAVKGLREMTRAG